MREFYFSIKIMVIVFYNKESLNVIDQQTDKQIVGHSTPEICFETITYYHATIASCGMV